MKVWGVTEAELRSAISEAGLTPWGDYTGHGITESGRALLVRLSVDTTKARDENGLLPFQARGFHGRRLPYVTWEGHREFMRIVFRDHPEARIKTAVADYKGREDFWRKYPATKDLWPNVNRFGIRR